MTNDPKPNEITVTCPHCSATLTIDRHAEVVIHHELSADTPNTADFEARLRQLEKDKARAENRLHEAMRQEKNRDQILADKFKRLLDSKPEDSNEPPLRDIDLD
jgi:hypothetical protein